MQKNGVFQIGSREGEISLRHFSKKAIGRKCKQDGNEPRSANQSKGMFFLNHGALTPSLFFFLLLERPGYEAN